MSNKIQVKNGILIAIIGLAALSRLLPHPPNFAPIGAMALFGAAYFSKRYLAFLVPFAALWISNLILDNLIYSKMYPEMYAGFSWFGNAWTYLGIALIAILGMITLKKVKITTLFGTSIGASVLFFVISNFGAWLASPMYPQTIGGLMASYTAGIPFFWNTLAGDLFYTGLLFGAYHLIQVRFPGILLDKGQEI